jgi:hypothetical protein
LALISVAQRWRDLAQDVDVMNSNRPVHTGEERQDHQEVLAALGRAVRAYWEHEKAQPVPDHLAKLAAAADEAWSSKPAPDPKQQDGHDAREVK